MFRRSSRLIVADLGASRVSCGSFRASRDGKLTLEHLFVEKLEGDLSLESLWRESVARTLRKISMDPRFRGQLSVALPGHGALTKFLKTPAIERSKRAKTIQFEASQAIPYPLEEVVWEHLVMVEDREALEIMLTAAKAELMLGLCAAVNSTGYTLVQATPSCLALYDAFRYSYPEIRESTLIIDVGARSTQLLLVGNGRFVGRSLTLGGNSVTQIVADRLGIEFAAAEKLKIEFCSGDHFEPAAESSGALVSEATETVCAKLRAEVVRSIINLRQQASAPHPTSVYLAGGASQFARVADVLGRELKVPVHRFESLRKVEVSSQSRHDGARSSAVLAQLVGLASAGVMKKPATLNLVPPVIREELAFRRRQPALVAAAILVVIALIPPLHHFHGLAEAMQTEAQAIESELRPLQDIQARTTELQQKIDQVRAAIAGWEGVADKKTTWLRFLADLQDRLGAIEDVWLESLSMVRAAPSKQEGNKALNGAAGEPAADLRLVLSGRLLDQSNPISKVSPESYERVKRLIASFGGSEFVAAVEHERFDNSEPGLLRFDFTLVVRPKKTL